MKAAVATGSGGTAPCRGNGKARAPPSGGRTPPGGRDRRHAIVLVTAIRSKATRAPDYSRSAALSAQPFIPRERETPLAMPDTSIGVALTRGHG